MEQKNTELQLESLRDKMKSSVDPVIIDEIEQAIVANREEINRCENEIECLEDVEYELKKLKNEALISIAKHWYESLKQDFPQFGATLLDDNTTIRLQIPINGECIYTQINMSAYWNWQYKPQYKLISCDGIYNWDMYHLLKDIIAKPTPQERSPYGYGYGYVDLKTGYKEFSDLIRKLEKL